MGAVRVLNLATRQEWWYTCSPREAVMAAYAQERKDMCTWDYEKRYASLVKESKNHFLCGDWCALKGETE